ncbi:twin-arginine translocation signal domain-containing protein [Helicobacter cappadocius]|uniref:Twin-arginine translocation signal domain-containing protein n=1 Tax=Helicobacter cappadocius TaxID=3063998 RepID=A0AA90T9J6_9HELI|nr:MULTISPECIES: twin-arginine translocation signal domain-containing protein [unclassified Helicobacter]MDO7252884.1 twin-arginine translocation signal domain-containing protein [Helicobacter sp. faydin-H75]MDP2538927.1 twin-arginine translocation signal domain-containing protein [Helicobacter sp. faydin-H76]
MKENSRRKFLKNTTKVGAIAAVGGLVINSCSNNEVKQSGVIVGKSNKEEILYQGNTKYWKTYYSVAK